ncbi:hypothetical protein BDW71DRAFT_212882 [Aspergillus fruticulosus]
MSLLKSIPDEPAGDAGVFGYILINDCFSHQAQKPWTGNEQCQTLPRNVEYDRKPEIDGFSRNTKPGYQHPNEASMLFRSPAIRASFNTISNSGETPPVSASISRTKTQATTAGEFRMGITIFEAYGSILPAKETNEKHHQRQWGSDHCFTDVGYARRQYWAISCKWYGFLGFETPLAPLGPWKQRLLEDQAED